MVTLNNNPVVFQTTLLVPDEQIAEISFEVDKWNYKIRISFHPEATTENLVESEIGTDFMHLKLNKWLNALGTVSTIPLKVGKTAFGREIELLIFHERASNLNRATLQFMAVGGQNV